MLASPHPPTPAQIKLLLWSDTTDGGVFAWYTEPNGRQDSTEKPLHIYIGSASKFAGGLKSRKNNILSPLTNPHDEGLKASINDFDLNPEGKFGELFTVPFKNGVKGKVLQVRELVVLGRLAVMVWLGAFVKRLKLEIKDLVPWDLEKIEYLGLAKDNPLAIPLNKKGRIKAKRITRKNKRGPDSFGRKPPMV